MKEEEWEKEANEVMFWDSERLVTFSKAKCYTEAYLAACRRHGLPSEEEVRQWLIDKKHFCEDAESVVDFWNWLKEREAK